MSGAVVMRARLDRDGRLLEADQGLLLLNARAGGAIGEPLAVRPVATVARLAGRLGVLIARRVRIADAAADLELWVRAEPDADGVALAVPEWRELPPAHPAFDDEPGLDPRWEVDAALRLVGLPADAGVRFGVEPVALLGRPITGFVALIESEDGDLPILAAAAARTRFTGQRARVRGSGRPVTLAGWPRIAPDGAFAGFAGTIEAGRGGIGADPRIEPALRAPLGRIVAAADAMHAQEGGPLSSAYMGYAADIASAGRHLLALVDDLADVQAIERPDFQPAADALDLADVARRAAGLLGVRAADAGVRIDAPALDEVLPAFGEFRRALQVMVNLVTNAVRYSPEGGVVWLRADRDGPHAAVVVADQGKGIAIDDQERIFGKFERVDRTEPGGSGIGLYVARRLARAMGGDLTVDSAPGQGARFRFWLPSAG